MTERAAYFRRNEGRVNVDLLSHSRVALVGQGSVGSELALQLARAGVGHLLLIDGGVIRMHSLPRHVLPARYVGANKADGMADYLSTIPGIDVAAINRNIDETFTDEEIDTLLAPMDLTIVATDDRRVQRRVSTRLLALDSLAVIPGLYRDGGGEIAIQLGPGLPCLNCWDLWRNADLAVRGVSAISADAMAIIQYTVFIVIGLLDPDSPEARELAPPPEDRRPRQLFIIERSRRVVRLALERRPDCPACNVGPTRIDVERVRASVAGRHALNDFSAGRRDRVARDWAFRHRMPDDPPQIEALSLSDRIILEGEAVTVAWRARNATYVTIDDASPLPTSGQTEITPSSHHAVTLRAYNPYGVATTRSDPVRVLPLPRFQMAAMPPLSVAYRAGTTSDDPRDRSGVEPFQWPIVDIPRFPFPSPPSVAPPWRPQGRPKRSRMQKGNKR
jgi:molybdopterin/thiamine biosynthesis adenylyltransferase